MTSTLLDRALASVRTIAAPPQRRPIVHHDPQAVFDFIVAYKRAQDGCAPSIREIMAACGIHSTSGAHRILHKLERQGKIELSHRSGDTRSIRVVGGRWSFDTRAQLGTSAGKLRIEEEER